MDSAYTWREVLDHAMSRPGFVPLSGNITDDVEGRMFEFAGSQHNPNSTVENSLKQLWDQAIDNCLHGRTYSTKLMME